MAKRGASVIGGRDGCGVLLYSAVLQASEPILPTKTHFWQLQECEMVRDSGDLAIHPRVYGNPATIHPRVYGNPATIHPRLVVALVKTKSGKGIKCSPSKQGNHTQQYRMKKSKQI